MFFLLTFPTLAFITSNAQGEFEEDTVNRVAGGFPASIKDYPFIVSIQIKDTDFHFCCGSIITYDRVVTACHCVAKNTSQGLRLTDPATIKVVTGSSVLLLSGIERNIQRIIVHDECYDPPTQIQYDIAVLVVDAFPITSAIKPISISTGNIPDGVSCQIAGWGQSNFGLGEGEKARSFLLQATEILLMNTTACCKKVYEMSMSIESSARINGEIQVCAVAPLDQRKGGCKGDSGGPLICQGRLHGIFSWAFGCAAGHGYPAIYVRVDAVSDWLTQVMNGGGHAGGKARRLSNILMIWMCISAVIFE